MRCSFFPHGALAQLVERQTEDLRVSGSIPEGPTTYGGMPERLKGADCKSVGLAPTLVQIQLPPPRQNSPESEREPLAAPFPHFRAVLLIQLRPTALGSQVVFCRSGFFFIKS